MIRVALTSLTLLFSMSAFAFEGMNPGETKPVEGFGCMVQSDIPKMLEIVLTTDYVRDAVLKATADHLSCGYVTNLSVTYLGGVDGSSFSGSNGRLYAIQDFADVKGVHFFTWMYVDPGI